MGYVRAGFDVTGVDLVQQRNYPFKLHIADALTFDTRGYDVIHASPPCQAYSQSTLGTGKTYPDLIPAVRDKLEGSGVPWILENVPGAPMRPDYQICGCMVGLDLRRVRWFETSWQGFAMSPPHNHPYPVPSVVGHGTPAWMRATLGYNPTITDYRASMGIDWMNRDELSQAIPPAYTQLIGEQALLSVTSCGPSNAK
jgi:DNA (cytosine-5)-methyltransferase 1